MKPYFKTTLLLSAIYLAPGILQAAEVNLYSARKEALIKPLLDQFTERTGVTVNLVTGKADALLQRLTSEGDNTPADLLITTDAGRLHRAKEAGVLQPVASAALDAAVPEQYRDADDQWYGLSVRARVMMIAPDRVDESKLKSYQDLANEEWKGRICIRSSNNIYNQSLIASMIAHQGEEQTEAWAKGLVENFARPPAGGDRDQIKGVAVGQCDIAVANTYYLGGMLTGSDETQRAMAQEVKVIWPNQESTGAHVNVSGAGVVKAAKNKENAIKLLEFLVSDEAQKWYAEENSEYPVKAGVGISDLLKSWGEFKADDLAMDKLGELNDEAVRLMDRAGWR